MYQKQQKEIKNNEDLVIEEAKEECEDEEGNVMMNIAHRNIIDFVDAPPSSPIHSPGKETHLKKEEDSMNDDGRWI